jgi:uncharacterized protein (TIGR00251 family)
VAEWFRCDGSLSEQQNRFVIQVKVKPRSSRNAVLGLQADGRALEVAVTAPPVEGEANEALIKLLSELLHLRKSAVFIARGGQSRFKQIIIEGVSEEQLRGLAGL